MSVNMDYQDDDESGELIDTFCRGCDLPFRVNDLGLCALCFAKLERDLIRSRDWEYSATAFMVAEERLEALRERIIREYGVANELIEAPGAKKAKPKNKRSHSRNTQRKRKIAAQAIRTYNTEDVLQEARHFLQGQSETWVNTSRILQHLYEHFYKLNPKRLGKKYKSLLKLLADYPTDFELRQDSENKGIYWIRSPN